MAVAICCAVAVLEGWDIQAIGLTAGKIGPALHLARSQMALVFAASNAGLFVGAAAGGWIADRIGRKPVLIAAVVMFGLFTVATALATTYPAMLAVRILTGLGLGAAMPNLIAIASDLTPPSRRAATTALMFCGMPLGGAAAALFTASLPRDYDYRLVFMIGGLLPLALAPLALWRLRETRVAAAHTDRLSALTALFGEGRTPSTLLLWTVQFPTLLIVYLMVNWLPTLVAGKNLGPAAGPQAAVLWNLGGIAGALVLARLTDRSGPRWVLTPAFLALVAAMVGLSSAQGLVPVLAMSALVGVFSLGAQYAVYGLVPGYYPPSSRGAGAGAAVAAGRFGSILGPIVGGMIPQGQVLTGLAPLAALAAAALFALTLVARPRTD